MRQPDLLHAGTGSVRGIDGAVGQGVQVQIRQDLTVLGARGGRIQFVQVAGKGRPKPP
jgi:hypothetical protein